MSVALLWDASHLWGLLARQAMTGFGVPCRLLKAQDIAQAGLSDKISLLVVPGGSARLKYEALGEAGREAIRKFVAAGGHYLGFCGGAGLALGDPEPGLGLCPWRRAHFTNRLQHQLSGPVWARFAPSTPETTPFLPDDLSEAALPVWWPGRFEPSNNPGDGVRVLARYAGPAAGLHVADLCLDSLPAEVLEDWQSVYGITLFPSIVDSPCVIHGRFGRGTYTLSYSHLETPSSPRANAWLAALLMRHGGVTPERTSLPAWHPAVGVRWTDPTLLACREGMLEILALGREHGLLFPRTPWLVGWRAGVPGSGLNTLALAFNVLASTPPVPEVEARWKAVAADVMRRFTLFRRGSEACLLAQRLAATVPELVPADQLTARRRSLFGSAMQGGGLYQELLDQLDELLFMQLQERD